MSSSAFGQRPPVGQWPFAILFRGGVGLHSVERRCPLAAPWRHHPLHSSTALAPSAIVATPPSPAHSHRFQGNTKVALLFFEHLTDRPRIFFSLTELAN